MNLNIIYRLLPETSQLLISQTAVRIVRSHAGGMQPTELENVLNLRATNGTINISTFHVQERKE